MFRSLFWMMAALIGVTMGCAVGPVNLPVCNAQNSPNSICGLMNPEDLSYLPGREWIIVSQMAARDSEAGMAAPPSRPGVLLAIRISDVSRQTMFPVATEWPGDDAVVGLQEGWGDPSCPGAPEADLFQPHGIDVGQHASGADMLAVVNHGGRESVEFFEIISGERPRIEWRGCVEMPDDVGPNDVALFADGGFVVTKFMPPIEGMGPKAIWNLLKITWGWDTGAVYRWAPGGEVAIVPGSEGSAPNGVAISADETEIFVAQWGEANVYRVSLLPEQSSGRREKALLDHHPDNLTWTDDGQLMVAGQGGSMAEILGCGEVQKGGCGLDYGVYLIDPDSLSVQKLFTGKGAASVALEVGDEIYVGVFSGDQVERVMAPQTID